MPRSSQRRDQWSNLPPATPYQYLAPKRTPRNGRQKPSKEPRKDSISMKFSRFFIDRPIFAIVISVVTVVLGGIAYFILPVAQFPTIAPPTVVVQAQFPGADPKTLAETVAEPIEQQVNGVENMLYMSSTSSADGTMQLTVTFKLGTDPNIDQVLVQNRVAIAQPQLPPEVNNIGVVTAKQSPDVIMAIALSSKSKAYNPLYLSNYAYTQMEDSLKRIEGVGNIQVYGAQPYSMRVWLDPDLMFSRGLTADDVISALQAQNLEVASGNIGSEPAPPKTEFQFTLSTEGRLVMRLLNNSYSFVFAKGRLPGSLDLAEDLLSFSPPDITLGIEIMLGEVLHDRVHQLAHAAEAAGQDRLLAQVSEEAFDQVHPG